MPNLEFNQLPMSYMPLNKNDLPAKAPFASLAIGEEFYFASVKHMKIEPVAGPNAVVCEGSAKGSNAYFSDTYVVSVVRKHETKQFWTLEITEEFYVKLFGKLAKLIKIDEDTALVISGVDKGSKRKIEGSFPVSKEPF